MMKHAWLLLLVLYLQPLQALDKQGLLSNEEDQQAQALLDISTQKAEARTGEALDLANQGLRRSQLEALSTPTQKEYQWKPIDPQSNEDATNAGRALAKEAKDQQPKGEQAAQDILKQAQKAKTAPWMVKAVEKSRNQALADITSLNQSPAEDAKPKIYVYISFGLSDDILKALFRQANEMGDVVFVIRGLINRSIKPITSKLMELTKGDIRFRLIIDPTRYKEWAIESVPVYQFTDESGKPVFVKGVASLRGALSWGEKHGNSSLGELYPIEEPDLIVEMKQAMANRDWSKDIAKAREKVEATVSQSGTYLPAATESVIYWVDPSIATKTDIKGADGAIVAREGQVVNPLTLIRLSKQYAIFNATDERQIVVVEKWLRERKNITLIATRLPLASEDQNKLIDRLGDVVMLTNPLINERFRLHHVPAIVSQDNYQLKVEVIDPEGNTNE